MQSSVKLKSRITNALHLPDSYRDDLTTLKNEIMLQITELKKSIVEKSPKDVISDKLLKICELASEILVHSRKPPFNESYKPTMINEIEWKEYVIDGCEEVVTSLEILQTNHQTNKSITSKLDEFSENLNLLLSLILG